MAAETRRQERPQTAAAPARQEQGRPVKPGHLPVSEILFSMAGAASPFGDELSFPLPVDSIVYETPASATAE